MEQNLIRTIRSKYHLTQQDLADEIGISREFVNKMEKGKIPISLKTEYKINQIFADRYVDKNSQNKVSDEDNITQKALIHGNPVLNDLSVQSLHTLIESNRILAETQQKYATAQLNFSEALKNLSDSFKKVVDTNAELIGILKNKMGPGYNNNLEDKPGD